MNYIGSKKSLLEFLEKNIFSITKKTNGIFIDGFSGTAAVGQHFQKKGFSIIANDIQYYSQIISHAKLLPPNDMKNSEKRVSMLQTISPKEGFIWRQYSPEGTKNDEYERMYFSSDNAKKIDAMRMEIEKWKDTQEITSDEYFFLLFLLLESSDKIANTASVYGAFLKKLKKSAQKDIFQVLEEVFKKYNSPLSPLPTATVYSEPIELLIKEITGDILYLDPPYNARQYAPNYHILETIAKYDSPQIQGKTGLRSYAHQKSNFCKKSNVHQTLETIIREANVPYIFLSYNNEGLMSPKSIQTIFKKYGECGFFTTQYSRFKADASQNRNHSATETIEYLHWVKKES